MNHGLPKSAGSYAGLCRLTGLILLSACLVGGAGAGAAAPRAAKAGLQSSTPTAGASTVGGNWLSKMRSPEEKDGYKLVRDVEFAPDRKLSGDVYLPSNWSAAARFPAVLIIHGGAFTMGHKSFPGETDLGERLAKHGYVAFSADYRLIKDGGNYPRAVKDCKDAFGFIVQNSDALGINRNNIGVFGASVGGYFALLTAYAPNAGALEPTLFKKIPVKAKAAVTYCPLTDIRDTELTWVIKWMDDTPWHSPEVFAEASPVTYAKSGVPTLCIHGTDDVTVNVQQSDSLVKALQASGVEAAFVSIPKCRHLPFHEEPGPVRELAFARLIEFFDRHLKQE